jgi:catechol 2,3-dioxygenase-like lactoylglutathione lyase family enzyme
VESAVRLITGIDHVNLLIDDAADALERADRFYTGILGLERIARPDNTDSGRPGVWYRCGEQELHLSCAADATRLNSATRRHHAFGVRNLDELRAHLERAGVEIIAGNRFPGQKRFFVRDPFGSRLEFVERLTR